MIPDWMGGGGSSSTPRPSKRITGHGEQTVALSTIGMQPCKGPLLCKDARAPHDGYLPSAPTETLVSDRWGKKKIPDKSGFTESDMNRPGTPSTRRPAPRCGSHGVHDRNNVRDYFMNNPDRKHVFKVEKRIIPVDGGKKREANPMSQCAGMGNYVVSPEAQRRHYGDGNDVGMLRCEPDRSAAHNLRISMQKNATRRHGAKVLANTAGGVGGAAGQPSPSMVSTLPSKRFYVNSDSPARRSHLADHAFSGGHARPKHSDPTSKIGSPWRR